MAVYHGHFVYLLFQSSRPKRDEFAVFLNAGVRRRELLLQPLVLALKLLDAVRSFVASDDSLGAPRAYA